MEGLRGHVSQLQETHAYAGTAVYYPEFPGSTLHASHFRRDMLHYRQFAVLLGLTLAGWSALTAQDVPPVQTIGVGETVTGYLTQDHATFQDGSHYQPYVFQAEAGAAVSVFLISPDFNANLLLADADDNVIENDDNGGGNCNAHLSLTLSSKGRYYVFVNAADSGEVGGYRLSLVSGHHPPESTARCQGYLPVTGTIGVGDTIRSDLAADDRVLSDSSRFEIYLIRNERRVPITIDLVSDVFDPAMVLVQGLREAVANDDDGGGNCNARIGHTPRDERPNRVLVFARNKGEGAYELRVTEGLSPATDQPACEGRSP